MIDQQLYGVKRFLDVIGTKRQVLIEARIVEAAVDFSKELGVDWKGVTTGVGNFTLGGATGRGTYVDLGAAAPTSSIGIGFITDNVPEVLQKATSFGAVMVSEPVEKPWGQVVAYLRDPDGFLIEVCTPMH